MVIIEFSGDLNPGGLGLSLIYTVAVRKMTDGADDEALEGYELVESCVGLIYLSLDSHGSFIVILQHGVTPFCPFVLHKKRFLLQSVEEKFLKKHGE